MKTKDRIIVIILMVIAVGAFTATIMDRKTSRKTEIRVAVAIERAATVLEDMQIEFAKFNEKVAKMEWDVPEGEWAAWLPGQDCFDDLGEQIPCN